MVLRKKCRSFRWKLFFPVLITMWICVVLVSYVKYRSIIATNTLLVKAQMESSAKDILEYYENDDTPRNYLTFLNAFASGTVLENMRLSVYERDRLVYSRGESIQLSMTEPSAQRLHSDLEYVVMRSNNGEIVVLESLPKTVFKELGRSNRTFWWLVIGLLGVCLVTSYIISWYLTRNIRVLSRFASQAAEGEADFDESKFSHDEIGDISRHIVSLYNDKLRAFARTEREHLMTMHAVEEKSRIKRQLTNNINHEIKTPVGVIRGYLDTVMNSPEMDADTKYLFLKRAHDNVVRLCDLLNDVSTMTRLEESGSNIPTTMVEFGDLVFGIETDLSASGVLGDMEFVTDIPMGCQVRGNSNLLTGIITNLIRNAVNHSRGTTIELKMIVESKDFYTFTFRDNGTGVDEEHIPHLFERFYRVDAGRSRKAGGTGLGLAIVKNAIEAQGGSISVHNRSTGGLEFLFTLEKWSRVKKPKNME